MSSYLVACSGGPDSMALLDLYKDKDIRVAHVNYHHRDSADRDEMIVASFCEKYHIPFYRRDYIPQKGNFQDAARVFRYRFFAELVKEYSLDGVLVAHQKDDLLETYLLQKQRGSIPSYYGLQEETVLMGVRVVRPLLSYRKSELEEYCIAHNIPYGIDESNLSDDYNRNKIRHHQLSSYSDQQIDDLMHQIEEENRSLSFKRQEAFSFIKDRKQFLSEEFLSYPDLDTLLRIMIREDLSSGQISELIRQLRDSDDFLFETEENCLNKEYGMIYFYRKEEGYSYDFDQIVYGSYGHFSFMRQGETIEGVMVYDEDLPITVRNYEEGDVIAMRFGHKKLSRFFIDRKIPRHLRRLWPVVLNRRGQVIFVPGLGCDSAHYSIHPNLFVIKWLS